MARFPFTDLHSFKDYVVYVQTFLPDRFPHREGAEPDEQWSLEVAFKGLRLGLEMARREKGEMPALQLCGKLFDEAYEAYVDNRWRDGFKKLEEAQKVLTKIPSW